MLYDLIKVQYASGKRRNSHLKKKYVLFLITCNKEHYIFFFSNESYVSYVYRLLQEKIVKLTNNMWINHNQYIAMYSF